MKRLLLALLPIALLTGCAVVPYAPHTSYPVYSAPSAAPEVYVAPPQYVGPSVYIAPPVFFGLGIYGGHRYYSPHRGHRGGGHRRH